MSVPGDPRPGRNGLSATKRALLAQRLKSGASHSDKAVPAHRPAAARPDKVYASAVQQSVYTAYATSGRSPAYHLVSAFMLRGVPDTHALAASFSDVVVRHEVLRTRYRLSGERVEMLVNEDGRGRFLHRRVGNSKLERAGEGSVLEPFDLERDPLIRLTLFEADTDRFLLLLVAHEIVFDGWSVPIFWRELSDLYRQHAYSEPHDLETLGEQFVDVMCARSKTLLGNVAPALRQFWSQRLSPVPPPIGLPGDRPLPRRHEHHGALAVASNDPLLATELRDFVNNRGITPFVVLLLAFMELLSRYCQSRDFLVATPIANRVGRGERHLIGNFVSTLPLRAPAQASCRVEDALAALRDDFLAALDHRDISLDQLLRLVEVPRESGRLPLVQVMFVYQTGEEGNPALDLGDIEAVHHRLDPGVSKYDLTLFVTDSPAGLKTLIEYRTALFDRETVDRFADRFQVMLRTLLESPGAPLSSLEYLSDKDRRTLDRLNFGPPCDISGIEDVVTQIFNVAVMAPDAIAVTGRTGSMTYRELAERAHAVSRELIAAGVLPGDRVLHYFDRDEHAIVGLLGIMRARAAYVPVDPAYPANRRERVVADARVKACATVSAYFEDGAAPGVPCVAVDGVEPHALTTVPAPDLDSAAYVVYTSGSTGAPKGVLVTHRSLCSSNQARRQYYDIEGETFLLLSSFAFDSSIAGIFETLTTGGELVVADEAAQRDPRMIRRLIEQRRVHGLLAIPALYREVLVAEECPLDSLARVIVAGEACDDHLVRLHFTRQSRTALYNEYGPSEATVWATVHRCTPNDVLGPVPIGIPIPGVQLLVLDRERRVTAPGLPGELYIGGTGLASGYLEQTGETRERFVSDLEVATGRYFRTGDKVLWSREGRLQFLGRVDTQVKLRGQRIELTEVESILLDLPGVLAAAASVLPGEGQGSEDSVLAAFLVVDEHLAVPVDATLRRQLARHLPNAWIPNRFSYVDALPMLPNGKLDRQALARLPTSRQVETEPDRCRTPGDSHEEPLERALAAVWEDVLHLQNIGPCDNYFDIGGTSLQAIHLFAEIESRMDVVLSPSLLLEQPTVRELASTLRASHGDAFSLPADSRDVRPHTSGDSASDARDDRIGLDGESDETATASLVTIQSSGRRAPIIAVPGIGGNVLTFSGISRALGSEQPFFGLQPRTFDDGELPPESIEEIAEAYIGICGDLCDSTYVLLGACFGANVALEMAHRLARQNRAPALLVVLDPSVDEAGECNVAPRTRYGIWSQFLLSRVRALLNSYRDASSRGERRRWLRLKAEAVQRKLRGRDLLIGSRVELRQHRVRSANLVAGERYRPQPYGGELVTLLTRDRPIDASRDPRTKWVRRMNADDTVVPVPGTSAPNALLEHCETLAEEVEAQTIRITCADT